MIVIDLIDVMSGLLFLLYIVLFAVKFMHETNNLNNDLHLDNQADYLLYAIKMIVSYLNFIAQ